MLGALLGTLLAWGVFGVGRGRIRALCDMGRFQGTIRAKGAFDTGNALQADCVAGNPYCKCLIPFVLYMHDPQGRFTVYGMRLAREGFR